MIFLLENTQILKSCCTSNPKAKDILKRPKNTIYNVPEVPTKIALA